MEKDPDGRARLQSAAKRGSSQDGGKSVRLKREAIGPNLQGGGSSSSNSRPQPDDLVEVAPGVTMVRSEAERAGYLPNTPGRQAENTRGRLGVETRGRLGDDVLNTRGRPAQRRRATLTTEELNEQEDLDQIFQETLEMDKMDMGSLLECNEHLYALSGQKVDVTEIYNPGIFGERATAFNLVPGTAYDLRLGHDLSQPDEQQKVLDDIAVENPELVVGSPPCSAFSTLQNLNDTSSEKYQETLRQGRSHLAFAMKTYQQRHSVGKLFLHEHPDGAWSWDEPEVRAVRNLEGVFEVVGDQCMFGQTSDGAPARKRTRWLTNCWEIAELLMVKCDGSHVHQQLIGGRAKATERYTPKLIRAILKGLRNYLVNRGVIGALEVGPTVEEPELVVEPNDLIIAEDHAEAEGPIAFDEYTGLQLDPTLTRKARESELEFLNKLGTWLVVPRQQAIDDGYKVIGTRWVECNKGDAASPNVRSRLVAQETKRVSSIAPEDVAATFAATPPLEALRYLLSLAMTLPPPAGDDWVLVFIDISRAHPNCKVLRKIYTELPPEAGYNKDWVAFLVMCLYGLRDAAQAFELRTAEVMIGMGFEQGLFSPCLYFHAVFFIRTWVNGDDFVSLVPRAQVTWFTTELNKSMIVKVVAILGGRQHGMKPDDKEVRIMNRLVTWHCARDGRPECIEWEADPRHVELLSSTVGLTQTAKSVVSPGVKGRQSPLEGASLDLAWQPKFKSACMRLSYLSADRPDVGFESKEIARSMSSPTTSGMECLKRVVRYLLGHKRLVWTFVKQDPTKVLNVNVDSDHAGCKVTRKSTTCVVVRLGKHLLRFYSLTQTIIGLSSGESEFYAMTKGAAIALGFQSIAKDWGLEVECVLHTDSAAAKGTVSRRGAGKLRHIETPYLWLQQAKVRRKLIVKKCKGTGNEADLGTKKKD